jgi:hypothetical protein
MKIGIIGTANMGALSGCAGRGGHDALFGSRDRTTSC